MSAPLRPNPTDPADAADAVSTRQAGPAGTRAASGPHRAGVAISLLFRVVLAIAVIAVGIGVYAMLVSSAPTIEPRTDGRGPARLVVIDPRIVAVSRSWTGFGTADATVRADVPARVTAVVAELPESTEAGRAVRRGDLLVRLDDSDFRRQVESSTAAIADLAAQLDRLAIESDAAAERARLAALDLEIAASDEGRVRRAVEAQAAQARELDAAIQRRMDAERVLIAAREAVDSMAPRRAQLAALRQVQASLLGRATDDVERCVIGSPIDGVIEHVDVKLGENVSAGSRIARVVGLDRIEIALRLPSSARREIALGDAVELTADARGDRQWRGEVVRIAPQDDPLTRTMTLFAEIRQDPDSTVDLLPPGLFVEGTVVASVPVRRVLVPRRAVRADRIFVIRDGVVLSQEIAVEFAVERDYPESGIDDTLWLALREPPPAGDLVVIDAGRSAVPGQAAIAVLPNGSEARADAGGARAEPVSP